MIKLDFNKMGGLIPSIAQDYKSGEVLMLAFMKAEAWGKTISTGKATYFSRSRQKLWVKGETSGNLQIIKEIWIDCNEDTILLKVEQLVDAACHTGHRSCFFKESKKMKLKLSKRQHETFEKVHFALSIGIFGTLDSFLNIVKTWDNILKVALP